MQQELQPLYIITYIIYPWFSVVAGMASAGSGNRGVPEAPGRPLSLAFTSRSVNLSWAPPFNTDKVQVSHYLVQVRAGEETSWEEDSYTVETPDNVTLFQVTGLNPFTTYSFRVTAVTASGRTMSKPSESSFYMFTLREGWPCFFYFPSLNPDCNDFSLDLSPPFFDV